SYSGTIYAHIGLTVDGAQWSNVIGDWGNNAVQPALTFVSGTTYKLELTPDLYTYFGVPTTSTITQICVVFRNAAGTQQWPTNPAQEYWPVGNFQLTLTSPAANSTTIIANGGNFTISAHNTGGNASYTLSANGTVINSNTSTSNYTINHSGISSHQNYVLEVVQGSISF